MQDLYLTVIIIQPIHVFSSRKNAGKIHQMQFFFCLSYEIFTDVLCHIMRSCLHYDARFNDIVNTEPGITSLTWQGTKGSKVFLSACINPLCFCQIGRTTSHVQDHRAAEEWVDLHPQNNPGMNWDSDVDSIISSKLI